jgi:hypothetical protein
MASQLDLKDLERKAFRSTYQDGLWDIYMGGIVASMSLLLILPDNDESSLLNILILMLGMAVSYLIFWAGKKYITLPRLGRATFGAERKRRKRTLAMVLGVIVAMQAAFLIFSIAVWASPTLQARLSFLQGERGATDLLVATIGALFVGPSITFIAYFNDFPRGYYIAVLMAAAVFSMIFFHQPLIMLLCAALIILPGVVLFVRFLNTHPLPPAEAQHG